MRVLVSQVGVLAFAVACGGGGSGAGDASTPACDQACADGVALVALRETMKLAYNDTLQGKPTGAQDAMWNCPLGGTAHISGTATSTADQGTTNVNLTYVFTACASSEIDSDPTQTFQMSLDGTVTENGAIAVQPSSTTALLIDSDAMTFTGTVYAPPQPYDEKACAVELGQNGNNLSGKLCTRDAGTTL
jgi:hypothetical protein